LIANMVKQDAERGHGFCVIDPHGDLAGELSQHLGRAHIYWDIGDPNGLYGYNPLMRTTPALRPLVVSGLIETLKAQWSDAWGPRMEHLLRFSLLALLERSTADLRHVVPMLIEKSFRTRVLNDVTDPQVLHFWQREFKAMNYKTSMDGVAPIANKVGAFLAHPVVRKTLCDPVFPLRFRRLMDERVAIIVNLAKGRVGGDIANVLGGLLVSNIMNAALSRQAIEPSERVPFFLYVDEFPSFTTSAFANMLAEARKYGLAVMLANQHVAQTDPDLMRAIVGNVASMITFRLGALDAPLFVRQFEGIELHDFTHLQNYDVFARLMVSGRRTKPFSARTFSAFYD